MAAVKADFLKIYTDVIITAWENIYYNKYPCDELISQRKSDDITRTGEYLLRYFSPHTTNLFAVEKLLQYG